MTHAAESAIQHSLRSYASSQAHLIVDTYSKDEVRRKASVRNVADRQQLQQAIAEEMFLQEYTEMRTWPLGDIQALARQLGVAEETLKSTGCDSAHLSWLVIMLLVRNKHKYSVKMTPKGRRIVLC